jgi:eukaryotic-like serine/threonine-protein kinase
MDTDRPSTGLDLLDQLADDFLIRRRRGDGPTPAEYAARHPELAARILELFPALELVERLKPTPEDHAGLSDATGHGGGDGIRKLGDYTLLRVLGRGGMGVVYEAEHQALQNRVALKIMHPRFRTDPTYLRRFQTEARSAARLHHTNIVPVFDFGQQDDVCYYAMQYIAGVGLDQVVEDVRRLRAGGDGPAQTAGTSVVAGQLAVLSHGLLTGRFANAPTASLNDGADATATVGATPVAADGTATVLPAGGDRSGSSFAGQPETIYFRELARLGAQVADALGHAHRQGVIHRDIKPSNLLLDAQGNVWVTDFGLAKLVEGDDLSQSHDVVGTLRFMPPERFDGNTDPRGDIYALGATLYELLTLRPAFDGPSHAELVQQIREHTPVPLRQHDRRIPRDLDTIVLKCMAKDPADRFATAGELRDELERFRESRPIRSRPVSSAERLWRWCKRKPGLAGLAASLAAAVLGGAVLSTALWLRAERNFRHEQVARKDAQQRFDLAMEAIKLFHGEVGDDLVLKADQFKPLRDKLLRGAADYYGKLEGQLKGQPDRASRAALWNAYFDLGELTSKIGDKPAALAAHRKGLAVSRELAAEPAAAEARVDVAKSLHATAQLLYQTGNLAEALARFEEARDLLEGLPGSGAGSDGRRALLGRVYYGIGLALGDTGKTAAAMAAYQRSVETLTRLADDNPGVAEFRSSLAGSHNDIGLLQWQTGMPGEALESYRRAVAIEQKLADDNPAVAHFRNLLAGTYLNIGNLHLGTGKPAEALEWYRRAVAIFQKLVDDNPAVTAFRNRLALTHNNIGNLQQRTGKSVEALESDRRALAIRQKLADDNPTVTDFRRNLADSHDTIGVNLLQNGKAAKAIAEFSREEAVRTRLVQENPSVPDYRYWLANCRTNTATALLRLGRPTEARVLSGRAMALCETLVKDHPEIPAYRAGLADCLLRSGQARRDEGDAAGAAADWRRADALLEGIGATIPDYILVHACCHASLSWAAGRPGSGVPAGEADPEAAKALALFRRAAEMGYRNLASYRTETALDPLRDRPDIQMFIMDLAFPADPFCPAKETGTASVK